MIHGINLNDKMKSLTAPWTPIEVARVNNQVVRMAIFKGEFHWHSHINQDELFYVHRGKITIRLRGQPDIQLNAGEMAVIPAGVEHCPESTEESCVLLFEPAALKKDGD